MYRKKYVPNLVLLQAVYRHSTQAGLHCLPDHGVQQEGFERVLRTLVNFLLVCAKDVDSERVLHVLSEFAGFPVVGLDNW